MEAGPTDSGRLLILVEGHRSARVPVEVRAAGLSASVGVVLPTYRPWSPDLVLDHDLWLTCLGAVGMAVGATRTEVFPSRRRRFPWGTRLGPTLGTLEEYGDRLRGDPDPEKSQSDLWDVIRWWEGRTLVAWARREDWFAVGGPGVYHDSYTTGVRVRPPDSRRLVKGILLRAREVGVAGETLPGPGPRGPRGGPPWPRAWPTAPREDVP